MAESKDKRTGWIAELVVGSLVFISAGYHEDDLVKVDSITPTGRIKIGTLTYDERGRRIGYTGYLTEVTPAKLKLRKNRKNIEKLESAIDKFKRSWDDTYGRDKAIGDIDSDDAYLISAAISVFERHTAGYVTKELQEGIVTK
jgi:hypothetical protein